MIVKILLIDMLIVAIIMYLVILGANKNKTEQERIQEDEEEIKILEKYDKSM